MGPTVVVLAPGRRAAEEDWARGRGFLFVHDISRCQCTRRTGGIYFRDYYDRDTGLDVQWVRPARLDAARCDGYNTKMADLVAANGDPPWSVRGLMPDDEELASYVGGAGLERVPALARGAHVDISEGIVLQNGGEFSRWGRTEDEAGLTLERRRGAAVNLAGAATGAVFFGRSRTRPRVVVIAYGGRCVSAYHEDGRLLANCWVWE